MPDRSRSRLLSVVLIAVAVIVGVVGTTLDRRTESRFQSAMEIRGTITSLNELELRLLRYEDALFAHTDGAASAEDVRDARADVDAMLVRLIDTNDPSVLPSLRTVEESLRAMPAVGEAMRRGSERAVVATNNSALREIRHAVIDLRLSLMRDVREMRAMMGGVRALLAMTVVLAVMIGLYSLRVRAHA
ncbi:MAG: hypothetical protein EA379_09425, partial [Phycisphaerales bacterium]